MRLIDANEIENLFNAQVERGARLGPAAQKQVGEKVLAQKTGKYHNRKTVRHGITFDSKHEADRYDELRMLLKAGEIHDLKLQQTYKLVGAQRTPTGAAARAVTYIADFVYTRDGKMIVEDAKGFKTKDYIIKKKLMLERFGIWVEEV